MAPEWLQIIAKGNQAGCFHITDPRDPSVVWYLYFHGKNLQYVTSKSGKRERLSCLLQGVKDNLSLPYSVFEEAEYENLSSWWNSQQFPQGKFQQLLFKLSQEALTHILTINNPIMELFVQDQIHQPVTTFPWEGSIEMAQKSSQKWQQLCVDFITPFSRLYLNPEKTYEFYNFWKKQEVLKQSNSRRISFWLLNLAKKKTLYELATERKVTSLKIAYYFRELLEEKVIEVFPFQDAPASQSPTIHDPLTVPLKQISKSSSLAAKPIVACIDDSHTVQQQVKRILEAVGYQVLSITDPTSSLTVLVRNQPVLILMDVKMPEIDGHQLCQMLQRSRTLRYIPIVMLTAEEGMVSRLQAKISGANYYLKKPCDINELISVVQRFALNKTLT